MQLQKKTCVAIFLLFSVISAKTEQLATSPVSEESVKPADGNTSDRTEKFTPSDSSPTKTDSNRSVITWWVISKPNLLSTVKILLRKYILKPTLAVKLFTSKSLKISVSKNKKNMCDTSLKPLPPSSVTYYVNGSLHGICNQRHTTTKIWFYKLTILKYWKIF